MKRKNKNIGARVQVNKILIEISPIVKWRYIKKVTGTIVDNSDNKYEHYYHTSSGANKHIYKHLIKNDCFPIFAIKLDNDLMDIEGNNIIVVREFNLKFLDLIEIPKKPISKIKYLNAKKIIEQYELENIG